MKPILGGNRENHYKVSDAREAMWRALTLKKVGAGGSLSDDVWPSDWQSASKEELRKAYWATTFRALGDAAHLLQDMAQPQHTRNDAHSGRACVPGVGCMGGHDSYFEKHLRARTLRESFVYLKEGIGGVDLSTLEIGIAPDQLEYQGYAKPAFNSYSDYFATAVQGGNANGRGLANYSNAGFYSVGTNINSGAAAAYPHPNPTGSGLGYTIISEPELRDGAKRPLAGSVIFRVGAVLDNVTGAPEPNVKLAAIGAWDQFLQQRNSTWGSYTLNYYNYDDQAKLLVPRAVGYSAGLIDYFFRGQLFVGPPAEGVFGLIDHGDSASNCKDTCGFKTIKLNLANSTPDIVPSGVGQAAQPQTMPGGTVVAVAKYRRNGACYSADLSNEYVEGSGTLPETYYGNCVTSAVEDIVVSDPLPSQSIPPCNASLGGDCQSKSIRLVFNFANPIPVNATDLRLQVVYRGALGAEADAVVVQTVDLAEPSYYIPELDRLHQARRSCLHSGRDCRLQRVVGAGPADELRREQPASRQLSQAARVRFPAQGGPFAPRAGNCADGAHCPAGRPVVCSPGTTGSSGRDGSVRSFREFMRPERNTQCKRKGIPGGLSAGGGVARRL
ncbi:MAG: hypothetical protein IPP91_12540 [Betaproteobacteria bacterium]|nr:hypothetical protein [Betaproteobacteria bacterium]